MFRTLFALLLFVSSAPAEEKNLADALREHGPYRLATVELVNAMPGQGVSSTFRFGQATGAVAGVLGALAVPVRLVTPSKWKGALGLPADKEAARQRAIETWPHLAHRFARKMDHGRAEAALLALYSRNIERTIQ